MRFLLLEPLPGPHLLTLDLCSSVAMEVIKSRSLVIRRISNTSIDDINKILDELAHSRGVGQNEQGKPRSMQCVPLSLPRPS